ncbi:hypothetical protein HCU62_08035 [Dissulfurirhabdus thermomarina]|nr:hypothetical protein [Dissulfurirhabdus thermomarina]NMX23882.1 hypothetical protein [Dissulfurirhabdus thermomarina]
MMVFLLCSCTRVYVYPVDPDAKYNRKEQVQILPAFPEVPYKKIATVEADFLMARVSVDPGRVGGPVSPRLEVYYHLPEIPVGSIKPNYMKKIKEKAGEFGADAVVMTGSLLSSAEGSFHGVAIRFVDGGAHDRADGLGTGRSNRDSL